jgi:Zn-dependent protease
MSPRTFGQRVKQAIAPLIVALTAALKFAPFLLKTGGTMFLSIFLYAQLFGWGYAAGFVLLIFVHEAGHLFAARSVGLAVGWPVFIPFMGALIALKEAPRNAWIESIVAIGGPVLGTIGALVPLGIFFLQGDPLYLAIAYAGFFLNLFNLVPIVPLDGGRIVSAISPWLWLLGLAILVPMLLWSWNILLLILVALSLPRVFALFRRREVDEVRYFECTAAQRGIISVSYFLLLALLGFLTTWSHAVLMHGLREVR